MHKFLDGFYGRTILWDKKKSGMAALFSQGTLLSDRTGINARSI